MIAVRLQGRLGNQLFQYAFIYTAAKKLNTSFYIDQYIESFIADKYFQNLSHSSNRLAIKLFRITGFKNIFSYHLRRFYYGNLLFSHKYSMKIYGFSDKQNEVEIHNNTIYQGYFQSVLLIEPHEALLRQKFILKDRFVNEFKMKYGDLYNNNTIVTVHIRRTDYINVEHLNLGKNDISLPLSYYQNAIKELNKQDVHFLFISDDPEFVKEHFKQIVNKTISIDNEIMDFQHLMNAHICVISNSTFSWWGAWLNSTKNKIIYCPKYYLGYHLKKEIPCNIYPDEWKQIDVG